MTTEEEQIVIRQLNELGKVLESIVTISAMPNDQVEKLSVEFESNARCRKVCITIAGREFCWCL